MPVTRGPACRADRTAIRTAFDALHEQRYAHHSTDEPVEIINLRLVARGRRAKLVMPPLPREGRKPRRPKSARSGSMSAARSNARFMRPRRAAGGRQAHGARAGERIRLDHGDLPGRSTRRGPDRRTDHLGGERIMRRSLNPVTLEVVRNALPAIANEMAADLHRTSYNMMIYEVRDFCTALVLPDGALVSQNVGGVSHFVADLGVLIKDGMAQIGRDGFSPDDVMITNHQRVAGQHLNNVVIYMPYFFKGELIMFSMVRAHWIDIGGMSTGFGGGSAVPDPWLEGLQLDQLKVHEAGEAERDPAQDFPRQYPLSGFFAGDMRSQIAACKLALRRLDELFTKFGRDTMLDGAPVRSSTRPSNAAATWSPRYPTASTRRSAPTTCRARRRASSPDPRQGHGRQGQHARSISPAARRNRSCRSTRARWPGRDVAYKNLTAAARSRERGILRRARGHHPRRQHR